MASTTAAARPRAFGDIRLDTRNGWLTGTRRINLAPAQARLLGALLAGRGNVMTAETLRAAMRLPGHPEVSMENLRVSLVNLRASLKRAGAATRIENRIGYGWRLSEPISGA